MIDKKLLIIFVRHPELGKVKTRLAKDLGEEKALAIYKHLLQHTRTITVPLEATKIVYYANEVQQNDLWNDRLYFKKAQVTGDLGEKMQAAFADAFADGYTSVVIVGSDCPQLSTDILEEAFTALENHDIVLGPAKDGGYYLLGMKQLHASLFQDMPWSTSEVFALTIAAIKSGELTYKLLPVLSDVDRAEDVDAAILNLLNA